MLFINFSQPPSNLNHTDANGLLKMNSFKIDLLKCLTSSWNKCQDSNCPSLLIYSSKKAILHQAILFYTVLSSYMSETRQRFCLLLQNIHLLITLLSSKKW